MHAVLHVLTHVHAAIMNNGKHLSMIVNPKNMLTHDLDGHEYCKDK